MPATTKVLVNFNYANGANPYGSLIADDGNLFGTTTAGGANGSGTVFEIAGTDAGYDSNPITLVTFDYSNGADPYGSLIADDDGNLFGTTSSGVNGSGTLFEFSAASGLTTLAVFGYSPNPINPYGSLIADSKGDLFGTTSGGGTNAAGTVFEFSAASGLTTLASFGYPNGADPRGSLIADSEGDLFGTTEAGGAYSDGTVFEIVNTGSGYTSTPVTLASFDGTHGASPQGDLIADAAGDLFGTTEAGGAQGDGTVFEIINTGSGYASTPVTLASFDGTHGASPYGGLIADAKGNLFGTTAEGGTSGNGTVFEIVKTDTGYASTPTTVVSFDGNTAASPYGSLIADAEGNLYGTTAEGGTGGNGTVFEITDSGFEPPCFAAGTRIATARGEVAVEALAVGERVVALRSGLLPGDIDLTLAGGQLNARPVKWVGRRRIDLTTHPHPQTVAPVRIQAGAFADSMPHTDLLVSPDHAIFVDGKLIAARQLVNGSTIRQEKGRTSVEYFHVELDAHAVLFAEGLPAESYLNTGNRGFFANSGEPLVLRPDLTDETDYPTRETGSCAPFVWDEAIVRPIWQRLAERAAALGQPALKPNTTNDPELRLVAKGRTLRTLYGENGRFIFVLPKGATEVRLISRAGPPADTWPWMDDRRRLGVCVTRLVLRNAETVQEIPVDHPGLAEGWWPVEPVGKTTLQRWTNGDANLSLPTVHGPTTLEICASGMTYVDTAKPAR